jgi:hypothetical protein
MKFLMMMMLIILISVSCISTKNEQSIIEEEVIQISKLPLINSIELILDYDLYYDDYSEIKHITIISIWIQAHFNYEHSNIWLSPEEIMQNDSINLNNFAILLMNIAKVRFNIEFNLVLAGTYNQAMIEYQGRIFNIFDLNYIVLDQQPNAIYLFNEVFQIFSLDFNMIL